VQPKRRHSRIGKMSPINFERQHALKKKDTVNQPQSVKHGLPTGCCAPVDKPPHVQAMGKSACSQASPAAITLHLHIQTATTPTSFWWTMFRRSRTYKLSVEPGQAQVEVQIRRRNWIKCAIRRLVHTCSLNIRLGLPVLAVFKLLLSVC
jgi:hypothetical protein